MIPIKFYPFSTVDNEFTVLVMEDGFPEFHFYTAADAVAWVEARGGFIGDSWEVNDWGNRFAHGQIESMVPVEGEALELCDMEVISSFSCSWEV